VRDYLYRFHWKDGTVNEGRGYTEPDVSNKLGFGRDAFAALDYWEKVD